MELDYSLKAEDESKVSKAMARDLNISFKHAVIICDSIRGLKIKEAKKILENIISKKEPISFYKFNTGVGHRPGGKIGKFPQKTSREILEVLKNLEANAEYKGITSEKLKIIHIQAQQGISRRKRKPKGRYRLWRTQLVNIQAIAKET